MGRRRGEDMRICWTIVTIACLLILVTCVQPAVDGYKIGVGRADCTGPSVEVIFMGYAQLSQKGEGIHLRQFSRAFIVEDDQKTRVAFVSFDAGMVGNAVKRAVVKKLKERFGNSLYTMDNVIVSGTHTHSAPGGFLTHLLYDLSTLGFVSETFNAYVDGIYNSIVRAHSSMEEGRIFIAETEIHDANINRSPNAYQNNPQEERDRFQYDVDKQLVQMRFVSKTKRLMGVINWFAVHPTSMNNTNRLISSDNVGYASVLLEQEYNPEERIGRGDFVGAFASTNLGDVSPNIMGAKCKLSGAPCDINTSSCPEGKGPCVASGPGRDMFESTKIIATRIYKGASKLLRARGTEVTGAIKFVHQYVNMTHAVTALYNSNARVLENVAGCRPAMGYSFAAGTTDGPGAFQFQQGTTSDNPLWNAIRDFIAEPSQEDKQCQFPKPILLASGRAVFPYEWQPKIVSTQMLKIGNVMLAAVPGEFTTMSGRRLRTVIRNSALQSTAGGEEVKVIVAGLANMYTSYITTPEEYEIQRYEGASTIFGPHTLTLYLEQFSKLTQAMLGDEQVEPGPEPAHLEDGTLMSLQPGVVFDGHPFSANFGDVRTQPRGSYQCGDVVRVRFQTANPRNDRMAEKSFFTVEREVGDGGEFKVVATDANWETRFYWTRTSLIWGHSEVRFQWDIPEGCVPGAYRIRHFGQARYLLGGYTDFEGVTKMFKVVGSRGVV